MSTFTVVSYYTENTGYAREARRLIDSLSSLGMAFDVAPVASRGSWLRNCAIKPDFILHMLEKHQRPIVWLDADAEVLRPLDVFQNAEFEFGVRRRHYTHLDESFGPWQSGTLYFGTSELAWALLKGWRALGRELPDELDQKTLYATWDNMDSKPMTHLLDWSYCTVFDEPGRPEIPHVVHHQASRRLKRNV